MDIFSLVYFLSFHSPSLTEDPIQAEILSQPQNNQPTNQIRSVKHFVQILTYYACHFNLKQYFFDGDYVGEWLHFQGKE